MTGLLFMTTVAAVEVRYGNMEQIEKGFFSGFEMMAALLCLFLCLFCPVTHTLSHGVVPGLTTTMCTIPV